MSLPNNLNVQVTLTENAVNLLPGTLRDNTLSFNFPASLLPEVGDHIRWTIEGMPVTFEVIQRVFVFGEPPTLILTVGCPR